MESTRVQAPRAEGAGYVFPERSSDCSGARPSWYPFQINVCDEDTPALDALPTARHRTIGAAQPIPWWPFQ